MRGIKKIRINKKIILVYTILIILASINVNAIDEISSFQKKNLSDNLHLSFAAFADTHIGARYQYPKYDMADYLDRIGDDLINSTNLLDFSIHLGDIINRDTAQISGVGLPLIVNQYKNNLKSFLISHINLPFFCVLGNHDINDYHLNKDDPHNLTKSLIDELSMNSPIYAMMRDGILFLIVPELGYVTWTHPVLYNWVEFITKSYHNFTTIILCHQAIEDTTKEYKPSTYRAKQDMKWWSDLFVNNSQIKMWIHGHNHYVDWYVGNESSGLTCPIFPFGHEMAFSAPYSQLDFEDYHEEDRIVIYNISSTKITTTTWENNGLGGHWVNDYINIWDVNTTYDPDLKDWYCFPIFIQDNETQFTDLKILSPNIKLQLVGLKPMELFYDSNMQSPSGSAKEVILGFGDDTFGNVEWLDPGMKVFGPTKITFPSKQPSNKIFNKIFSFPKIKNLFYLYPDSFPLLRILIQRFYNVYHEDGRSGQLYQGFPIGTICSAISNQTYNFTINARCISGEGRINLNVSCCDWDSKSQYSVLKDSEKQVISHNFGQCFETISGSYQVSDDESAWFLQGFLDFLDTSIYEVSLFSVKRSCSSTTTDDFHLLLNDCWYNDSGSLDEFEVRNFSVNPIYLSDVSGVMNFTGFIDGNCFGMVNLIFQEPIFLCRNARFKINDFNNGIFNLSLTKKISRSLNDFKLFPFSTDAIYESVNVVADDGSEIKHVGDNGNIWFSCNNIYYKNRNILVILNNLK